MISDSILQARDSFTAIVPGHFGYRRGKPFLASFAQKAGF